MKGHSAQPTAESDNSLPIWLGSVSLIISILLIYYPAFSFGFVSYDDEAYVSQNAAVQEGLTLEGIQWACETRFNGNWHPLLWLSFMLDSELYDMQPGGFHATNVFLHIAATLLLFISLKELTRQCKCSLAVAMLFAITPLCVEAVTWISERKGTLSTFFWMLALFCYGRYARTERLKWMVLTVLATAAGLMCKPMLVSLPLALLLLDLWPLRRWKLAHLPSQTEAVTPDTTSGALCLPRSWKHLLLEKTVLFALVAGFAFVAFHAQADSGAIASTSAVPVAERAARIGVAYWIYLRKAFYPFDLAANYASPREVTSLSLAAFAWIGLIIVSAATIYLRRRAPYFFVGWWWYVITFIPVIGITPVGAQWMADRYAVIPLIGIWIALVWTMSQFCSAFKLPRWAGPALALIGWLAFTLMAARQVGYWKDTFTLFHRIVEIEPNNALGHRSLGAAYGNSGDLDTAVKHFRRAIEISPNYALALADLGQVLIKQQHPEQAIPFLKRSLAIAPDDPVTLYQLALANLMQGRYKLAIAPLERSLQMQDEQPNVHHDLGLALARLGKLDSARQHWEQTLKYQPDHGMAHGHLARLLANAGELPQACEHYEQAMELAPSWPQPVEELAWMLAFSDPAEAENVIQAATIAQRGLDTSRPSARLLAVMAAVSARQGDYSLAAKLALRAAELADRAKQADLSQLLREQAKSYQAGRLANGPIQFEWD